MHKSTSNNAEIQLYYKDDCSKSKKAIAYAKSISNNVNAINISLTTSTGTVWQNILGKLAKSPKQLMDKSKPYYQANIKGRDFEDRDWTFLLMNNPDLLKSPIAVRGNKAMLINTPTDIFKL